ncbi:hypothetical protein EIP91_010380 [Steccherinum ochraceum]|uniref:Uncharacterized protein n=1 Tax=Steccherinum ochraceum TaxID=92696 RepID=A0A4R0RJK5_9APHY|nr:hypothetical protein EIP91_010380 [Steccherinum ochraceum]
MPYSVTEATAPFLNDVWWTGSAAVARPIPSKSTASSHLDDVWWASKRATATTAAPTAPPATKPVAVAATPSAPAPTRRPLPDDATTGRVSRVSKVQPLTWTERILGSKHQIAPKQNFIAVYGSTYHKQTLISLEDAQSRPAIRLRSIQHLTHDLPMSDFPGVKLLSLEDAGASGDIKYRSVL